MGIIDATLTQLSYFHFWTDDPTTMGVTRAAAIAFGFFTVFTFVVACSKTISFTYPLITAAVFAAASLIHIIQLKELRIQNRHAYF